MLPCVLLSLRKTALAILSVAVIFLLPAPSFAGEYTPVAVDTVQFGGLENLAYFAQKVRNKEPVVIGYIGGSITQGSGASAYGNNYFWKSKLELEKAVAAQGSKAITYTAAIGGTGSDYACYRANAQLFCHKPDLLIVEFSVNDGNDPNAADSMECLIRQARKANPKMGIVLFYTTIVKFEDEFYSKGLLPRSVMLHHKVAAYYGLAEVLTGMLVDQGIKAGTFTDKTFFTDGTHPSDIGHAFYADTLVKALQPLFALPAPAAEPAPLPALLGKGTLEYAHLAPAVPQGGQDGWSENIKQYNWYGVPIWKCDTAGKPLVFPAKGKRIQIVFQGKIKISWTVDGREHVQELTGRPMNWPMPGSWAFPKDANPDGALITAEAVPDAAGKAYGEVWGLFSIQAP